MIRTILVAFWAVLSTAVLGSAAVGVTLWRGNGDAAHVIGRFWAGCLLALSRVRVRLEGLENIDPRSTYVFMANHQSMFDIPALQAHLPMQFRWLAKKELFEIPIFGHAMAGAGYIPIDRSNRRSAHKSLMEGARKIAEGVSVVVFPEGSRSKDGEIMPFLPGGFHLAARSGRPIVPVVMAGTHAVLPKGSLRMRPGRVVVSILRPIDTASLAKADKQALMDNVRSMMIRELERLKAFETQGTGSV